MLEGKGERERMRGTHGHTEPSKRDRVSHKQIDWVRRPLAGNSNVHQRCFMCECM